jgi:hypothetical protein
MCAWLFACIYVSVHVCVCSSSLNSSRIRRGAAGEVGSGNNFDAGVDTGESSEAEEEEGLRSSDSNRGNVEEPTPPSHGAGRLE